MFVLNDIETLQDDLENLPEHTTHKLTFRAVYTISGVPDTFTGIVYEDAEGNPGVQHFNNPRGNKRKVITLKNKLAPGSFDGIRALLFARASGEEVSFPQEFAVAAKRKRGQ